MMMRNLKYAPFLAVALTAVAACTSPVGPQDSLIKSPSLWQRLGGATPTVDLNAPLATGPEVEVDHKWWEHFDDPTLDVIITGALANNKTLQIAKARVEEARAGRRAAQSLLLPQINGSMGAQRANLGYFTNDQEISFSEAEVVASWEFDLFGRNQARTAAATAILQSEEATRHAVRVGLLAEVARDYFEMRNYERQIDLTKQNLETQKKTLELLQAQMQETKASDLDVQRAKAQVSTTESLIPALQTAYDASLNRLNLLSGYPPGSKDALLKTTQELKPLNHHILIAAPAKVLATRPDLRAAERRFAASISAKYVAQTGWFPDISLTAFFGRQAATPFSSTPWGLSAILVQPILNFGQIEAQIDAADAQQKQAYLNYQQTVLGALENMEDALSSYLHETIRNASLTAGAAQNRKAAALVKLQYKNGYASFLDVLIAERNLLIAESSQASSDFSLRNDLVNIYAAAGGGWSD
jgi:multidrug efflux system outer membrane protein